MQIPSIDDPARLIALAGEIAGEAAGRYRLAAEHAGRSGRHDLARLLRGLAEDEAAEQRRIAALTGPGIRARPVPAAWLAAIERLLPALDLAELIHARPYAALAEAVREKERAFRLFSYLSAQAESAQVQALADDLAVAQLQAAHALRRARRTAFHARRAEAALWPPPREIETPDQLIAAARSAEATFLCTLEGEVNSAPLRDALVEATLAALPGLTAGESSSRAAPLALALEAFAFYDAVAGTARRDDLLAEAQALTAMALARIELICGRSAAS